MFPSLPFRSLAHSCRMIPPEDRDPAVPIFAEAPEGTPWMAYDFITVGAKHVWFWRYEPGGPTHGANHKDWSPELHLAENPCILVKKDPMCAALPPHPITSQPTFYSRSLSAFPCCVVHVPRRSSRSGCAMTRCVTVACLPSLQVRRQRHARERSPRYLLTDGSRPHSR